MLSLHLYALCIDAIFAFTCAVYRCFSCIYKQSAKMLPCTQSINSKASTCLCLPVARQTANPFKKDLGSKQSTAIPSRTFWGWAAPSSLFCRHEKDRMMIGRSIREQNNSVSEPLYPCPEQLPVCWELKIKRPLNIVRPSFVTGCN